jgi:hypothetical protein
MQLAICSLFHPVLHGMTETSSPEITGHFLVYTTIELADFYEMSYLHEENHLQRYYNAVVELYGQKLEGPRSIRNYLSVAKKYSRLEIIQADVLSPGEEEVGILKTFWLRLIQRRWRKIYQARKRLIKERSTMGALRERQLTGQWPRHLRQWPAAFTPKAFL